MNRSHSRRKGGFTLIEVLLVLVILVVLASLAVMAYGPIQKQSMIKSAKIQVGVLSEALKTYQLDCNSPPPMSAGLSALREKPGELADPSKWNGPYLDREIPADPWGKAYQYASPSSHNNPDGFDVWTIGPDGQEIGNWTEAKK